MRVKQPSAKLSSIVRASKHRSTQDMFQAKNVEKKMIEISLCQIYLPKIHYSQCKQQ